MTPITEKLHFVSVTSMCGSPTRSPTRSTTRSPSTPEFLLASPGSPSATRKFLLTPYKPRVTGDVITRNRKAEYLTPPMRRGARPIELADGLQSQIFVFNDAHVITIIF